MKKIFSLYLLFIFGTNLLLHAQINVPLAQIIAPTNHIYLSPNGNDANAGTANAPKKTFFAALNSFPFGISGVNNSQSYNEIIFLAGDYYPTQTLSQTVTHFLLDQNGIKRYKNVSIRGIGKVVIHGDSAANAGYSTLVSLMGSHIYVKNIELRDSKYAGIKFIGGDKHCTNILVDSLKVIGATSHGCLFTLGDTIWVKNSVVTNTCNESSDEIASNCQWGSALKTEFCTNIRFESNEVYRNWGEGINTSLSEGIYCYRNKAYDNYSTNFYLHSAAKGVWESNLVYNEDSLFWRSCYNNGNRFAPSGISVANELTCTYACVSGGNNQNCGGKYHCCAYEGYDIVGYKPYPYRQTDSIFIYNNVLLQTNIDIWDAFSGFFNYGFIKDIYVENNTIVGVSGRNSNVKLPIKVTLGTAFVYAQNIFIRNNIFTKDTTLTPNQNGLSVYVPSGVCNGLGAGTIVKTNNNRWNVSKICANTAINTSSEQVKNSLPTYVLPTQLLDLVPNNQHAYWIQSATPSAYITKDFFGNSRLASSNVGAFEQNSPNALIETTQKTYFALFPNPANESFSIESTENELVEVLMYDLQGKVVKSWSNLKKSESFSILEMPNGVYWVKIVGKNGLFENKKLCVFR